MRILVIDDKEQHQLSAYQTLRPFQRQHSILVAESYDEAFKMLVPLDRDGHYVKNDVTGECWDVVLSDLLLPASTHLMREKRQWTGNELPLGWALVMRAIMNGALYAAVVTDGNHHDHPAILAMEALNNQESTWEGDEKVLPLKPQFTVNGARLGMYYNPPMVWTDGTTCPECHGTGVKKVCYCVDRNGGKPKPDCSNCNGKGEACFTCKNTGKLHGKDWGRILKALLEG